MREHTEQNDITGNKILVLTTHRSTVDLHSNRSEVVQPHPLHPSCRSSWHELHPVSCLAAKQHAQWCSPWRKWQAQSLQINSTSTEILHTCTVARSYQDVQKGYPEWIIADNPIRGNTYIQAENSYCQYTVLCHQCNRTNCRRETNLTFVWMQFGDRPVNPVSSMYMKLQEISTLLVLLLQ